MALDLVVRGGMVMDGSGGPRCRADVGVSDGRITAVGRIRERAATQIDADGHVVAPGFIDGHTHLDAQMHWDRLGEAQMHWDRLGESSCWHGVTTVLMGNCGFTLAPCRAEEADLVFRSLEQAEEIPRDAMLEGIDRQWETMPEYLDVVDRLVDVMSRLGAGLFQLDHEKHLPGPERAEYNARLRSLAIESGRPMFFMLTIPPTEPDLWRDRLAFIDAAALDGARMYPQVNVHEHFSTESFRSVLPFDRLPGWSELRRLPLDQQRHRLVDPEIRAGLVAEAAQLSVRGDGPIMVANKRPLNYGEIVVFDTALPPYRSVEDVARERGTGPVETMIDLALESDFDQLFGRKLLNFDLDSLGEVLGHPLPVIGVSDTGAHVKRVADSSYPTRFLADWVRTRQAFEWEEGIRMLTSVPAHRYGFTDRGHIREGLAADLVVFDPETVGPRLPTVANDFPTGALRLQQKATGMAATVVNGRIHLRRRRAPSPRSARVGLTRASPVGGHPPRSTDTVPEWTRHRWTAASTPATATTARGGTAATTNTGVQCRLRPG